MSNTNTHSRAKKGGQFGANGEWYEGGKFINTVPENPKGKKEVKKTFGKQEVEPYKWEVGPEGKISLFRQLAGIERFNRDTMTFSLNPDIREGYYGTIEYRMQKIALFNSGVRWV